MQKCEFNKVACNYIEITLLLGDYPLNLLHVFKIHPFYTLCFVITHPSVLCKTKTSSFNWF